ncbi:Mur ligase domain-containing protein [Lentisphaerota bacterium ZTH]|nr:hypothetical protein JYG24_03015 [Lentisphaerota bacterium]WET07518.1 Mur ligase domain-containing protein [Lentisphaerota bacterium ZTH]
MRQESNHENFPGRIHFVGIGGAGTAPLAGIMLERGHAVSGSDIKLNDKTSALAAAGADVFCGHCETNLAADTGLLVFTSAAEADNPELMEAEKRGIPCVRRGEFLARLSSCYRRQVAITGSHGKTTVTAMLVWLLRQCGIDCGYLIGGKVNNFKDYAAGDGDVFVTEADESDGTHAFFQPWLGVVTNVEDDHSWSVGGDEQLFENFKTFGERSNSLLCWEDDIARSVFCRHENVVYIDKMYSAFKQLPDSIRGFMRVDSAIVCAVAAELGLEVAETAGMLASFPGVDRRMTRHYKSKRLIVIEDYAHHPTEVKCALELLRITYPARHLRVVFQPHRFARLAKYIDDFALQLKNADSVFTVPVFAAWTEVGPVDSADLAESIGNTAVNLTGEWMDMPASILNGMPEPAVVAVLGAGDVDELIPFLLAETAMNG